MSELYERSWPVDGAKGAVVIVHGLAEHSGRYEHVAAALNAAGYAAYARDLRGHGHSVGFPGDVGGDVARLAQDIADHCVAVHANHPRTFLLAHSLGSLLALPAAASMPVGTIAGLVLSGLATAPGPAILESLASGTGLPAEAVSRDPVVVKAYKEDPLVFYDRVPVETMVLAVEVTQRAVEAIPLVQVPVLLLHGADDVLCDPEASRAAHAQLNVSDKTLIVYEGLYHEVFNEPEQDRVLADTIAWLDAH